MNKLPCVISIAGTDPSGGAGIQADIKAISATGAYAGSIITALVTQNTQGVGVIQAVSAEFVRAQIDAVFSDLAVDAVKIGMLHDARIISVVAQALSELKPKHVVFDPVMTAKDGSVLLDLDAIILLKQQLLSQISLLTPNLVEAAYLLGTPIANMTAMALAAQTLGQQFAINVLLKGGHLASEQSSDVLYDMTNDTCHWFHEPRIATKNTHGTGCSLSAAIASYLAQGQSLYDATKQAKAYLTDAIRSGARYQIGQGNGPVDHFYFLANRG